ncbi:orotidine-5'-phosphate decarboxylase [Exiguobacterium acetylicum]|uniref:orotidine-5'-phosphate decarboxylase n=1 Tax=Exiguobacterium acetylicum TaxID=41170 RepID=UPI001EE236CB|nr:orotidine-5'-phosphate decarboxylase [Exiguobacterium acetylicum]UKS55072.1 orotidine-5'-phosphate decarboxylase [Exiguobacterium acetylicum]
MSQLYIALDFPTEEEVFLFLERFEETRPAVKVGMELFYAAGGTFVRKLVERGHAVFLDVKVHDIPETARRTMRIIGQLGVELTNVHVAGGKEMMIAAREGLRETSATTQLIGVTQLTSTDESMLRDLKIEGAMPTVVREYAQLAEAAGLDGVVCSALDLPELVGVCRTEFRFVTPGIRPSSSESDDQKRVSTVLDARRNGATDLVIGRPITRAKHPEQVYQTLLEEWKGQLSW